MGVRGGASGGEEGGVEEEEGDSTSRAAADSRGRCTSTSLNISKHHHCCPNINYVF